MIDQFKSYLLSLGQSQATIRGYVSDILTCQERGILSPCLTLFNNTALLECKVGANTKRRMSSAIKKWFKYLIYEGIIEANPTHDMTLPKTIAAVPITASDNKIDQMLEKSGMCSTEIKAATYILYTTGCRIGSLVGINIEDINFESNTILFNKVKNNKPYSSILSHKVKDTILQLIKDRTSGPLFISHRGGRLSADAMRMRLARELGSSYVPPHAFRHHLATTLVNANVPESTVKSLLNHTDISSTYRYIHLDQETIIKNNSAILSGKLS